MKSNIIREETMARKGFCLYCFESGLEHKYETSECRAYAAQVRWNKMMRRLLADKGESVRAVEEAPTWTAENTTKMLRETALSVKPSNACVSNEFMRSFWSALASPVGAQFNAAIQRAEARVGG